jgi:hypothetical protein
MQEQITVGEVALTDDDLYRRILTWHFFKGDGNYFSTRFLKRRIWRFLYGTNGWSWNEFGEGDIADTRQISISLGANRNITIRFILGERIVTGGAILNTFGPNGFGISIGNTTDDFIDVQLNDIESTYEVFQPLPFMAEFKKAMDTGVLELPYQFNYTVHIG